MRELVRKSCVHIIGVSLIAIYIYLLSVWGKGVEGRSYWFLLGVPMKRRDAPTP